MDNINEVSGSEVIVDDKIPEISPDLSPERLENESFEDYKIRRKEIKKWCKRVVFYKNEDDHNRDFYRGNLNRDPSRITSASKLCTNKPYKKRFRATKELKYIRGKYFYGNQNVSEAIRRNIDPVTFVQLNILKHAKEFLSKEGGNENAVNIDSNS